MGIPGGAIRKKIHLQCRRCKGCGFSPCIRKIPGEGNGNPLQYSCLEKPMDKGAWRATVHGVTRVRHNGVTNTFTFSKKLALSFSLALRKD